ncbi:MAG: endonuclease III [Bdellovibrionales bacterium]|nr:endonuclease III [Bdellovibrionales bacterium]
MEESQRRKKILALLAKTYPDAYCALHHETPFQLLIATILSAQCTDERVNKVTPELFEKYPDAKSMSKARITSLESLVRSTGFYRSKAKSLKESSIDIVERFDGKLPRSIEELTQLRGVGRKTANVLLGNAFGINKGVVVDTHVGRLSRRFGLTKEKNPVKVEKDLMEIVPKKNWTLISHQMIFHGRALCKAQRPQCGNCPFALELCPSAEL